MAGEFDETAHEDESVVDLLPNPFQNTIRGESKLDKISSIVSGLKEEDEMLLSKEPSN